MAQRFRPQIERKSSRKDEHNLIETSATTASLIAASSPPPTSASTGHAHQNRLAGQNMYFITHLTYTCYRKRTDVLLRSLLSNATDLCRVILAIQSV